MKFDDKEIIDMTFAAKALIHNVLQNLEEDVLKKSFGNLDIRSDISRKILAENGIEMSAIEAKFLTKYISFETAKIIGKLENELGISSSHVVRNNSGYVDRNFYLK